MCRRWPPTPSITEVKERVELYLYSPIGLRSLFQGELYLYLYIPLHWLLAISLQNIFWWECTNYDVPLYIIQDMRKRLYLFQKFNQCNLYHSPQTGHLEKKIKNKGSIFFGHPVLHNVSTHNQYSNIMYAIGYTVATCFERERSSSGQ